MKGKRESSLSKLEWMINTLLVVAAVLSLVNVVWGLDTKISSSSGPTRGRDLPLSGWQGGQQRTRCC